MEFIAALIWLAIVSFSFGFALTRERSIMAVGFGIAAFCVLSTVFNLLHIPLNWAVFLVLAVAFLLYFIWKGELILSIPKLEDKTILWVLLLAIINFYIYWLGSMTYPYLEDDDSWLHATGSEWITVTGSFSRYFDGVNFYRMVIEPYPPSYDILMGVIHQMTPSISTTLKLFNSLLIALGLIFAFYAIDALTKNRRLALLATFFLLALPAFMSHFIWAQTLALVMLFVSFYAYERALSNSRFVLPAGVAVAAVAISQPSTAAIFVILSIIYTFAKYYEAGIGALRILAIIGIIGILLASIYWIPTAVKYGLKDTAAGIGIFDTLFKGGSTEDTSGGAVYSLSDYLFPQLRKIDQQIGIGLVLTFGAVAGAVLCIIELTRGKKEAWLSFTVIALVFGFLGTEGNMLPIKLFPHRFWVFLAIPVAMLSAYAYLKLERLQKHKMFLLIALVIAVFISSALWKLLLQTTPWSSMASTSQDEIDGYLHMKNSLPENTKVFPLCSDDSRVIGNDMLSEPWIPEYEMFKRTAINRSADEVYAFLKSKDYKFIVLDSACNMTADPNKTTQLISVYSRSPDKYEQIFANKDFMLFRLK